MRRMRMFALTVLMSGVLFASAGVYAQDCAQVAEEAAALAEAAKAAEASDRDAILDAIGDLALAHPECAAEIAAAAVAAAPELAEAIEAVVAAAVPDAEDEIAAAVAAVLAAPPGAPEEPVTENPAQDVASDS